jgi:hypothetical protein
MSYRKQKKAWKKWDDGRHLTQREKDMIFPLVVGIIPTNEKLRKENGITIVGKWEDDLIWCPSQCYLKIIYRQRWFVIYLRWRHSDPWRAYLCETAVGNVDRFNPPGWDMHDPGYQWIQIPVDDFRDDQLVELKNAVMSEVKRLLLRI